MLPHAGAVAAAAIVERLRAAWMAGRRPVTFSAGIAEREAGCTPTDTLARADHCLYAAKTAGRNRNIVYATSPWPERSEASETVDEAVAAG